MKKENLLSIGQFATAAHLSQKALRIYDKQNILKPVHTDSDTSYRYYHTDQLPTARHIRLLRQTEMPLTEIHKIIHGKPEDVPVILQNHLQTFEARYTQVRTTIRQLLNDHNKEIMDMAFNITSKEIAPQQALCITKEVYISGLGSHIKESLQKIQNTLNAQGGKITAAPFGIYHGPVNQEENGPMEVCVPVDGAFKVSGNIVTKELPGGDAASVIVENEQCNFPAITDAYDALYDWITTNGYELAESPREIWISAPGEAQKFEIIWQYQTKS